MAKDIAAAFIHEAGTDQLQELSVNDLLKTADKVRRSLDQNIFQLLFQPAIDPATLPAEPVKAIADGAAEGIPMIIGTNRDEAYLFFTPDTDIHSEKKRQDYLHYHLGENCTEQAADLYPHSLTGQIDMMTDLIFWRPAVAFAQGQSRDAPVWMYRFDWHGETPPFHKAVHALELPFVFGNFDSLRKTPQEPLGDDAEQLSKQIQSAWLAFAKPETRTPLTSIGLNMKPIHAKLCFSTRIPLSKVIPIQQNAASCFKHKNAKGAGSLAFRFHLTSDIAENPFPHYPDMLYSNPIR